MDTRSLIAAIAMAAIASAASAQPVPRPAQPSPPATPVPAPPSATDPAPTPAAPPAAPGTGDAAAASGRSFYQVEGFRSARFNMTEQEVREAINRDFPRTGNGVRRLGEVEVQPNRVFRTTALVFSARNLMPDTGLVHVEYILGHQTRRLIQVNLIWGTPWEPQAPLESVQTVVARLQTFFVQERFPPDSINIGVAQPDGSLLVFRGRDEQGRIVEVVANGQAAREGQRAQHWVRLSYILTSDPERADIFRLRRGDF